jgi:effector-binding domain-containing protein
MSIVKQIPIAGAASSESALVNSKAYKDLLKKIQNAGVSIKKITYERALNDDADNPPTEGWSEI